MKTGYVKVTVLSVTLTVAGCVANPVEPPKPQVPIAEINTGELHYGIADVTPRSDTVLLAPANRHVVGSGHQVGYLIDYNATIIAPTRPPAPDIIVDPKKSALQQDDVLQKAAKDVREQAIKRKPAFEHNSPIPGAPATPMHPSRQEAEPSGQTEALPGVPTTTPFDLAERKLDQINGGRLARLPGIDMENPIDKAWVLTCEGRSEEMSDTEIILIQETTMPEALEPYCDPESAIGPTK